MRGAGPEWLVVVVDLVGEAEPVAQARVRAPRREHERAAQRRRALAVDRHGAPAIVEVALCRQAHAVDDLGAGAAPRPGRQRRARARSEARPSTTARHSARHVAARPARDLGLPHPVEPVLGASRRSRSRRGRSARARSGVHDGVSPSTRRTRTSSPIPARAGSGPRRRGRAGARARRRARPSTLVRCRRRLRRASSSDDTRQTRGVLEQVGDPAQRERSSPRPTRTPDRP